MYKEHFDLSRMKNTLAHADSSLRKRKELSPILYLWESRRHNHAAPAESSVLNCWNYTWGREIPSAAAPCPTTAGGRSDEALQMKHSIALEVSTAVHNSLTLKSTFWKG